MTSPTDHRGAYQLIVQSGEGFLVQSVPQLGHSDRPSIDQLNSYLPSLGLLRPGVDFALYWSADEDSAAEYPVIVSSISVMQRWTQYQIDRALGQSFLEYLNQPAGTAPDQHGEKITVDVLNYMMKRVDMSPAESMARVVQPPDEHSQDYHQLVVRPGEIFMLLRYVEKHLSYYLVTRHLEIVDLYADLHHAQTESRLSSDWFEAWWDELEPLQKSLVAQNSDKGFGALVDELDQALSEAIPASQREPNIANLKELVTVRNTIGHATMYNEMAAGDRIVIEPHITKCHCSGSIGQ